MSVAAVSAVTVTLILVGVLLSILLNINKIAHLFSFFSYTDSFSWGVRINDKNIMKGVIITLDMADRSLVGSDRDHYWCSRFRAFNEPFLKNLVIK